MAGGAPEVRLGEDRRAPDGKHALASPALMHRVAHAQLRTVELHRREEFPVRKLCQALGLAAHADELLDVAVPGCDVRIADRPVDRDAFARVGLEVEVAPAVDLPPPHERAATDV